MNFSFTKKDAGDKRFDGSMDGDFTPIPSQWYAGIIEKTDDIKPTNDGAGTYLPTTWALTGKHHAGRKVFLNIGRSGSEGFVNMGNGILGSILDALNMEGFQSFAQVMNKPMAILVKLIPEELEADGVTVKRKAKNEIKGILPFAQLEKLRAEYAEKHPNGDSPAAKKTVKAVAATDIPDTAGWDDEPAAGTTAVAEPVASAQAPAQFQEQPWNDKEKATTVVTDVPPPAVEEVAAPAVVEAWEANGWIQHPKSPAHVYKGKEAKTKAEVNAFYAAEAEKAKRAAAEAAAAKAAPDVPDLGVPPVEDAGEGIPPWASDEE